MPLPFVANNIKRISAKKNPLLHYRKTVQIIFPTSSHGAEITVCEIASSPLRDKSWRQITVHDSGTNSAQGFLSNTKPGDGDQIHLNHVIQHPSCLTLSPPSTWSTRGRALTFSLFSSSATRSLPEDRCAKFAVGHTRRWRLKCNPHPSSHFLFAPGSIRRTRAWMGRCHH